MYDLLKRLAVNPVPFCHYTAPELWTRPHTARQMLAYHLDGSNDIASRSSAAIEAITSWIDDRFSVRGKAVCDLGCGPGLYARQLAQRGAEVTGFDISSCSLAHARQLCSDLDTEPCFMSGNYLNDPLPSDQDLVLLIYADYCALSPQQRAHLLAKMRGQLRDGGHIILDVFSDLIFSQLSESLTIEQDLMGGFWAPAPYVGLKRSWLWPETMLALDHYLIANESEQFEICNWTQYFSPEDLRRELASFGFEKVQMVDMRTREALGDEPPREFAAILSL